MVKQNESDLSLPQATRREFMKSAGTAAFLAAANVPFAPAASARANNERILIRGGTVLTFDPVIGDFEKADVLIEGKKIVAVQPSLAADARVIDASNMIVMPGFIDTHHHHYHDVLRNVQANGLLSDYFRDISTSAAAQFRPQDAYTGNLIGALRAIDAGITTVTDTSAVSNTPAHTNALIQALNDSGIRAVYCYSRPAGSTQTFINISELERILKQYFASSDQLVTPALDTFVDGNHWQIARRYGLRSFTHVLNVFPGQGTDNVMALGNLMGPDNVYIHFSGATVDQTRRVKDTGGWLSLAAPIEMSMRHGLPVIQQALDAGMKPSLSSDVDTNMSADMFTQMRSVFTLQRALVNQRAINGEQNLPPLLTAHDVIDMATVQGARTNGLDGKIGTLKPGKEADIILLRTDAFNTLPFNNAYGAIVTGMDTSNVDTVIIAGRVMKYGGRLVDVNLDRVLRQAADSRDYLFARLGWRRSILDTSISGHTGRCC
ncbi:amidohydrolase family protein [Burkholderia cenocepacia]|uniref:Amidohydrolase family protein n=1 Tax=Burkholderia cenocepacia TaxID=95486 RepID=A0AAN0RSN2_9BURK|nr:amidohydrolase family protein [Burkholderia cenocepacia]